MQYHQLRKLVQALQVSCHLYPLLRLWSLLADSEKKRIQAFETKCLRKHPRISHLEHKTNDWVRSKINFRVCPQEPLLATDKRWKLAWFGHVTRHDSLSRAPWRVGDAVVFEWYREAWGHCARNTPERFLHPFRPLHWNGVVYHERSECFGPGISEKNRTNIKSQLRKAK